MQDEDETVSKPSLLEKAWMALLLVCFLGGGLPLLARLLGFPFEPSRAFYADHWGTALAFGAFVFFANAGAVGWTDFYDRGEKRRGKGPMSPLKKFFMATFGSLLIGFMAYCVVVVACPMLLALIGGEVSQNYTVAEVPSFSDRKCRAKVDLRDMPFVFGELCNVPQEIRAQLKPGMQIALQGYGNRYGLYYNRIVIPQR